MDTYNFHNVVHAFAAWLAIATDSERNETEFNTKPFHDRYTTRQVYSSARNIFNSNLREKKFETPERLSSIFGVSKMPSEAVIIIIFTKFINQSIFYHFCCWATLQHLWYASYATQSHAYRISHLHPLKISKRKFAYEIDDIADVASSLQCDCGK